MGRAIPNIVCITEAAKLREARFIYHDIFTRRIPDFIDASMATLKMMNGTVALDDPLRRKVPPSEIGRPTFEVNTKLPARFLSG